jgi:hypothetical protein
MFGIVIVIGSNLARVTVPQIKPSKFIASNLLAEQQRYFCLTTYFAMHFAYFIPNGDYSNVSQYL